MIAPLHAAKKRVSCAARGKVPKQTQEQHAPQMHPSSQWQSQPTHPPPPAPEGMKVAQMPPHSEPLQLPHSQHAPQSHSLSQSQWQSQQMVLEVCSVLLMPHQGHEFEH